MAVLDSINRGLIRAQIIRDFGFGILTKPNMLAAINAVDDWADSNASSFNTALPEPFKSTANAAQKALILAYVCMRRAGVLKVQGE